MSPNPSPSKPGRSAHEGTARRHLPADLVSVILSKLPTRSLVRFRLACREWRSMIDAPLFVANHLEHTCKSRPPAIAVINTPTCMVTILGNALDPTAYPPSSWYVGAWGRLITPCNGLLCVPYRDGTIKLENLAISQCLVLPTPPIYAMGEDAISCFFGYHPVTKKYKMINFFPNKLPNLKLGCEVYTVGSGPWRRIEDLDFYPCNIGGGICINGIVYWNSNEGAGVHNPGDCIIVALDLASEKFSIIQFHCIAIYGTRRGVDYTTDSLFEFESSLCLAVSMPKTGASSFENMDIWMLVDGPENKWEKKFSFLIPWGPCYTKPLMIHEGKVFLESNYYDGSCVSLGSIDLESGSSKQFYRKGPFSHFFPHIESLLSPNNL